VKRVSSSKIPRSIGIRIEKPCLKKDVEKKTSLQTWGGYRREKSLNEGKKAFFHSQLEKEGNTEEDQPTGKKGILPLPEKKEGPLCGVWGKFDHAELSGEGKGKNGRSGRRGIP